MSQKEIIGNIFILNILTIYYKFVFTDENVKDFYIDVSNNSDGSSALQCAHEPNVFAPSETRVYTCPCGIYGRYVRIRYNPAVKNHMELCEVQVQPGG